jgi:hypothetical protein
LSSRVAAVVVASKAAVVVQADLGPALGYL